MTLRLPVDPSRNPCRTWSSSVLSVSLALTIPVGASAQDPAIDDAAVRIADGRDLPVQEHVLENGMRFLLLERAGAPIVSFVVHVPVGSVNESPGSIGISHFLEHLLFKGTTTIGTGDLQAERALFDKMDATHDSLLQVRGAGTPDRVEIERLEARLTMLEDSAIVWAEQYFGPLEPGELVPPPLAPEPLQLGERRVEVRYDAEPQIRIGWKIPSSIEPEAPTFAILANILVGGRGARLHRRLVRNDRLASSVFAGAGPGSLYPGLFTIQATPLAPHTPQEVKAAIYDELERLRVEPPTDNEIARVRTRLEATRVRRLTSAEGLAFQLVSSQANWGDWRETFRLQERMREVDPEDVVDVLTRYFGEVARTVAILLRDQGP